MPLFNRQFFCMKKRKPRKTHKGRKRGVATGYLGKLKSTVPAGHKPSYEISDWWIMCLYSVTQLISGNS
jgi:hypothetical protein